MNYLLWDLVGAKMFTFEPKQQQTGLGDRVLAVPIEDESDIWITTLPFGTYQYFYRGCGKMMYRIKANIKD